MPVGGDNLQKLSELRWLGHDRNFLGNKTSAKKRWKVKKNSWKSQALGYPHPWKQFVLFQAALGACRENRLPEWQQKHSRIRGHATLPAVKHSTGWVDAGTGGLVP